MSIDDRGKTLENKYAHDEAFRFRVNARAARLFGLWAAPLVGRADVDAYAEEVIESDFEEPGIKDILRKVGKDFDAKGTPMTEHQLENQFNVCLEQAKKDMAAAP